MQRKVILGSRVQRRNDRVASVGVVQFRNAGGPAALSKKFRCFETLNNYFLVDLLRRRIQMRRSAVSDADHFRRSCMPNQRSDISVNDRRTKSNHQQINTPSRWKELHHAVNDIVHHLCDYSIGDIEHM